MNNSDLINNIISSTDIKQLISERVKLSSSGSNAKGLCPFHNESTPSFHVYDDHYHCFGCAAHGDVITFVRKIHGFEFIEAVKYLAKRLGIDTSALDRSFKNSADYQKINRSRTQALELALRAFCMRLWDENDSLARQALDYLQNRRGFSAKFIKDQKIGLSLAKYNGLFRYLRQLDVSANSMIDTSLVSKIYNKSSNNYQFVDFFQDRIIFPIFDHQGKIIAFSGRIFTKNQNTDSQKFIAKYKNSRYEKKNVLYGYCHAKEQIKSLNKVIVTEGYMDCLALVKNSIFNSVACQGTALTINHLKSIQKLTKNIYLLFDGDTAGKNAALNTLKYALNFQQLNLFKVTLPDGHDPDSYLKEHSKTDLINLIDNAPSLMEYAVSSKLINADSLSLPAIIQKEFFPWVISIESDIQRDFILRTIADYSSLSYSVITKSFDEYKSQKELYNNFNSIKNANVSNNDQSNDSFDQIKISLLSLQNVYYSLMCHLYYFNYSSGGEINRICIDSNDLQKDANKEKTPYLKVPRLSTIISNKDNDNKSADCQKSKQSANKDYLKLDSKLEKKNQSSDIEFVKDIKNSIEELDDIDFVWKSLFDYFFDLIENYKVPYEIEDHKLPVGWAKQDFDEVIMACKNNFHRFNLDHQKRLKLMSEISDFCYNQKIKKTMTCLKSDIINMTKNQDPKWKQAAKQLHSLQKSLR